MQSSLFDLVRIAQQTLVAVASEKEAPLTTTQVAILGALNETRAPLTQVDIIRATRVDRSTLAVIVKVLVARGYVKSQRDETDARHNRITLTWQGSQALLKRRRALKKAEERVLEMMPESLRHDFIEGLRAIEVSSTNLAAA